MQAFFSNVKEPNYITAKFRAHAENVHGGLWALRIESCIGGHCGYIVFIVFYQAVSVITYREMWYQMFLETSVEGN